MTNKRIICPPPGCSVTLYTLHNAPKGGVVYG